MSPVATALIAWAGVYAYITLYFGALYVLRRQHEYLAFAGLCGSLGLGSLASALIQVSPDLAHSIAWQRVQYVGFLAASAFFVDFGLRIAEEPRPRIVRAAYVIAGVSISADVAGLFFDAAHASSSYDWGPTGPLNRPIAELAPVGAALMGALLVMASYVVVTLFRKAPRARELRVASIVTAVGVLGGAFDLACRVLDRATVNVAAHAALFPVLGFSYVLLGRFTRVDAQLADRTEELARSYDHMRHAQEELVKKEQLAAIGELSAVIAHEVRNPLAIIKNAVAGLRRVELAPDDAETLLGILDEETDRLNRLVNDLLAYAKPIAPEPGHVDMRTLVMHAVELAAGGNDGISHIEIELDLEREVDPVEGDEALLRHALINIVDNALQAMPLGGTLTITCRNTELGGRRAVAVDFHDTGEGMDTLVRSKARDPFFTTRQTGTGLGLAIVDRVARVHGGTVDIQSRHGQGSTVSFLVPCERGSTLPPPS